MFHNPGQGSMQGFGGGFSGDGGFQPGVGGFGSPSGGVDRTKKYKPQNIIPITAQHIQQLSYDGSTFTLGGVELGLVTIVGNIIGVEKSQTCTTYQLDDSTGDSMNSSDYPMDNTARMGDFEEGIFVRVFGQIRSFQNNVNLNAHNIQEIEDINEITVHMLECIKFKLTNEAKKADVGKMQIPTGGGFSAQTNSNTTFNQSNVTNMGMDTVQAQVWRLVESCQEQIGMSVSEIRSTLKNLNINQIRNALDFLSNEGHIYSTIDEDHFRSTS